MDTRNAEINNCPVFLCIWYNVTTLNQKMLGQTTKSGMFVSKGYYQRPRGQVQQLFCFLHLEVVIVCSFCYALFGTSSISYFERHSVNHFVGSPEVSVGVCCISTFNKSIKCLLSLSFTFCSVYT